ncbi:SERPIN domain-containing protein [Forsythia ovata]|uniref:SERPIN domain-containing protein n=1 Tax=Forsythia ovata TaxID=205694 RepID=A0ABD1P5H5_9LAMI
MFFALDCAKGCRGNQRSESVGRKGNEWPYQGTTSIWLMYFKGVWNDKFDASKTKDDKFFLPNGSSVQVPLMTSKKMQYIREFSGFKVLGLPYKQGEDNRKFSMYFFLPDAKDGLPALVEKFGTESSFGSPQGTGIGLAFFWRWTH